MFGRRARLVVNILILLVITLSTTTTGVRCQDAETGAAGDAAGSDNVKDYLTSGLRLEHELVKEQADEPSTRNSGESIVAIHVDAVGAREQLRPSLRGLSYIAISFLPKQYSFGEVLSATREVVAGVRYELVVRATDSDGLEMICKLTVLEKPWLTTESGDKYRLLEHSNCTSPSDGTTDATVEVVTKLNPMFDPSLREQQQMSPSRFKDLVNQIIVAKHEVVREITTTTEFPTSTNPTEESTTPALSESARDALDQLFLFGNEAQQRRRVEATADERRQEVIEEVIVPQRVQQQNSEATTTEAPTVTTNITLDQQVQSTFEEVFKTHQEIQKALDEVIRRGGGRDVQLKYEPVFASLLQKVKSSIDNYYRTINPDGGEANLDTTAFVIRDSMASVHSTSATTLPPTTEDPHHSSETDEDDQQQQQVIQPDLDLLQPPVQQHTTIGRDLAPPKIDSVVMHFSDDSDEQQDVQRPQTREELARDFNVDDSQQRNKRGIYSNSHEHDFLRQSPFFGASSDESHEPHYGRRSYHGYNPHLNPYNPYNYQYRRKRFVVIEPNEMDQMEKTIQEAIQMLDTMDGDPFKRVLLDVINVKRMNQFGSALEQKGELFVARVVTANSHCIEEAEDVEKCKRLLVEGSCKFCTLEMRIKDDEVRLVKSECAGNNAIGGHRVIDVSEPEHNERIRNGLLGYSEEGLRKSKFIIRCGTVQVVAGAIYRYNVDLVNGDDEVISSCKVQVFSPLSGEDEYKFDCNEVTSNRVRRDVERKKINKGPKTGSPLELTEEEYSKPEHAERISSILVTSLGDSEHKYRVVGATQQLVAGTLYTYKVIFNDDPDKRVCKLTAHERPWLKEKSEARKVSYWCPEASKKRVTRSCPGCPEPLTPNDLQTVEHLERVNKILVGTVGSAPSKPEIISATHQVVAGSKYTYEVAYDVDGVRKVCTLTSWERPWLSDKNEAYKYTASCDGSDASNSIAKKRSKRGLVGGARTLSKEELEHPDTIARINKILVSSGGVAQDSPKIINGTSQVVAGTSYTYYVSYPVDSVEKVCYLNAWERPWLEEKSPTEAYKYTFRCEGTDETKRSRRHAKKVGNSNELSVEDLRDVSHVERIRAGLVSYNSEKSKSYQDFEILKGSVQMVAGSLYKYTFKVKDDPNVICKISVWERVWLDTQDQRKYNIKCDGDELNASEQQHHSITKRSPSRPLRSQTEEDRHYSKGEDHARHLFEKFKLRHNRTYQSSLEHEMRFRIFTNNLFRIEQLNKHEQGTAKYGITHFADMTSMEFRMRTGLIVPRENDVNHIRNPMAQIDENMELPASFDWRELGAVSPVKNQGSCGSCWAFSVVGNIEGLHQVKTKTLEEYSEQELLDCDTVDGACGGGFMDDAYKAIEKIGGLELESEYPYLAKKQKTCHFNKTLVHVRVKGAVDLPKNETAIAQFLVANGPVSIGLNANAMQFYRGGVSHPWKPLCSKKNLDHGVLIVGYGIKEYPMFNKTMPYWIVKNSWGPKWGEQGYYRVFRGDNTCGVAEMATSAVLE